MSNQKRIFPIKNDPACLLKWGWSSVYLNSGTTSSCHRTKKHIIDPDNFQEFHNHPEKIKERQLMLKGQWPGNGCEYCKKTEEAGGLSDRQFQLQVQKDPGLTAPELNVNEKETQVTPTMLEVYFNNTCNMACVYCGPHFSSLWEAEDKKFGVIEDEYTKYTYSVKNSQHNQHYDKMCSDLWKYLETQDRYKILKRYHILGGEPFLMKELDDSIEFWSIHANPDLVFSLITNLNIPHKLFLSYMDRFQSLVESGKIWKLQITGSLDCWGPEQEYARYGLDLKQWQQNFEYLLDKKWVTLSINSALSALTIKKLPELIEKINEWNTARAGLEPIILSFNWTQRDDNPMIFGPGVFDKPLEKALQCLQVNSEYAQNVYDSLEGILKTINTQQKNPDKILKLKKYLDLLDARRGTDWKQIFPWLDEIH
jgi:hypothetical protein